ncbi:F0F1 ATP synthase subunit B [Candidatus Mycoplasma pogonae]
MEKYHIIQLLNDTTTQTNQNVTPAATNQSELGKDMTDLFSRLFPNVYVMLATIISLIILTIILYHYVQKPVREMIARRKAFIQENIDSSVAARQQALELEQQKNTELTETRIKANNIIQNARLESEKIALEYAENAKKESNRILENANKAIKLQEQKFNENAKKQIVDVAMEMAQKVLEEKINKDEEAQIIDKLINKEKQSD